MILLISPMDYLNKENMENKYIRIYLNKLGGCHLAQPVCPPVSFVFILLLKKIFVGTKHF